MIAGNVLAPISHMLKSLIKKIREEVRMKAEFGGERDAKRADQDVILSVEQTLHEADTVLAPLATEEELIQADADSSDQGKMKKMVEAVSRTYKNLQFIAKVAKEKRAASIAASEALKEVPKAKTDGVLDALSSMEIRRIMRGMVQADRMKLFDEAIRTKNTGVQRAVLTDPFVGFSPTLLEPLVPQDYIDRMRNEDAQTTRTKEWRRYETLVFAAEKLEILAGAIEANLGSYRQQTPAFQPKPVRESDLGMENPQSPPKKNPAADKATATQFQ